MASKIIKTEKTMIEAIKASLDFAARGGDGVAAPVAVLWTDADGQWQPALRALHLARKLDTSLPYCFAANRASWSTVVFSDQRFLKVPLFEEA